jgi:2-polyprenyl-3-methyl-5-hydroxy-6-metoxy-1,4-benzoquinol methylase
MVMTEKILQCPVCSKSNFSPFLDVKDYFLTQESFSIQQCVSCGFRFVNPRPDKEEIDRYYQSAEYISHDAEKSDLISRIYRMVRKVSIRGKFAIVKFYCPSGQILDIGCGTGEFLKYCHSKGFEIKGIEPSEKARAYARTINAIDVSEKLDSLSAMYESFTCITMWHVLEHIHDLNELIIEVKKLLSPKGIFIIAIPNSNSWDAVHYGKYWAAYDVPRHLYHFTKDTILKLASHHDLEVRKIYPQKYDAYYVSMLSEKYRTGKANYFNFILNGLWSNFQARKHKSGHSSLIFVLTAKNA